MAEQIYDHLLQPVRTLVNLPKEQRVNIIEQDSFIPYQLAESILAHMQELLNRPKTIRPEGVLLSGPSGNGKTAILHEFVRRNPSRSTPDVEVKPVVFVESPPSPGEKRLLASILQGLGYQDWDSGDTDRKLKRVLNALDRCSVRLIIIDEIHSMLGGGKKLYESLNVIKTLSNLLKIPIILAGVETAKDVISQDKQVSSRFPIIELPLWSDGKSYRDFLYMLESTLPLARPSQLCKSEKSNTILKLSGLLDSSTFSKPGTLGNIVKLVKHATILAIEDSTEQISSLHLKAVARRYRWSDDSQ